LVAGIFSPVSGEISNSSGAGGRVTFTATTKKKISNFHYHFSLSLNGILTVSIFTGEVVPT
jgi:hypothetical protein